MDAFKLFDWDGKGWITLPEFREGLNDLGVVSDYDTVGLLFKRYDRNGDHKIRYSEFADALTPQTPEYAERLSKREPQYVHLPHYRRHEFFEPTTRAQLRATLRAHLSIEESAERIRKRLYRMQGFNLFDAF